MFKSTVALKCCLCHLWHIHARWVSTLHWSYLSVAKSAANMWHLTLSMCRLHPQIRRLDLWLDDRPAFQPASASSTNRQNAAVISPLCFLMLLFQQARLSYYGGGKSSLTDVLLGRGRDLSTSVLHHRYVCLVQHRLAYSGSQHFLFFSPSPGLIAWMNVFCLLLCMQESRHHGFECSPSFFSFFYSTKVHLWCWCLSCGPLLRIYSCFFFSRTDIADLSIRIGTVFADTGSWNPWKLCVFKVWKVFESAVFIQIAQFCNIVQSNVRLKHWITVETILIYLITHNFISTEVKSD